MAATDGDELAQTAPASDTDSGDGRARGPVTSEPERYLLLDQLGAGGMGVVWSAYDRRLDRKVALKLLRDSYLGAESQERLAREAKAMARLAHPNVVPVFDVGEREGRTFLAMELVDGQSLSEWLRERRTWQEIVAMFRGAARGLAAAHAAGLVHRDVKPGNILVGKDGRPRVADFGVSRAESVANSTRPEGGAVITVETAGLVGSPAYMAPEQLRGDTVDARCDQFGLCVALHEALSGTRPFLADTVETRLTEIAHGPPPLTGDVPEWLRRVVMRGLAADADARFPSMSALADALALPVPSRAPRYLAAGGIAIVAAGAAVLASGALRPARHEPAALDCAAEANAAIDPGWNAERRRALVAAFQATGAKDAAGQGERVAVAIDRHVEAWRSRWETTCRATGIDHSWPAEVGVLSRTCLEGQRTKATALFDALTRADASAVSSGLELVNRLDPPMACGDPDLLRGQVVPPRDPAQAAAIAALERRDSALGVAISLRRFDEVARDVPGFLADAQKSGDARMETRAALVASRVARDRGELDAAIPDAKRAYLLARRHRDVALAAEAAGDLVWLLGYFKADHVAGEDWADLAQVEMDSIPSTRVAIHVHQAIGVFAESRGEGPRAIEHQRRALELTRRHFGPDHYATAKAVELLASALSEAGRPAEAAALYRESQPMVAKAYGETSRAYAHLLSHYAITLKNAGDDARAIPIAEQALAVGRAAGLSSLDIGSLLLNYGAVLQEAGRVDDAMAQLRAAREAYLAAGERGHAAQAQLNVGGILVDEVVKTGDVDKERQAFAVLEEAAREIEAAWGPTERDVALALTSQARLHGKRGRCARAIPLAERAIKIYELSPDLPDVADPLVVIGMCRLDAGKPAEAVAVLERASKAQHAHGNDPDIAARIDADLQRARDVLAAAP
jgi:tetratricopeptide (TPR) repeat protein/predicted Ser/Thr protein kinase